VISSGIWPLVGADEMRALDRHTIDGLGVPGDLLMESAGRAVAERVLACLPKRLRFDAADGRFEVCVVCGGGNNGGDGLVVARHLQGLGLPVRVALLGDPGKLRGDAAANLARARAVGVALDVALEGAPWRPPVRGAIVDAIFGTGLTRRVEGPGAEAIARINQARSADVAVIAVDLPSGLDADTGQVLGVAVAADETVTIGLPKLGLALEPGRSLSGAVHVARIGIADEAPGVAVKGRLYGRAAAGRALPRRPRNAHKGSFGHVLVVAGSEGKSGAAHLASLAAVRAGAGLVTLACPAGLGEVLEIKTTEVMTVPVPDTGDRALSSEARGEILALAAERDVVAMGPGIGLHRETVALVQALAAGIAGPLVIDADGLNAFAEDPAGLAVLKGREAPTILTPHPGEAARLLGSSPAEINGDRVGAARELSSRTASVVLLKGASSVVADVDGGVIINPTGGPGLATGGTGDVLTGVVAAHLAQGLEPLEAAAMGAYLHGAAADELELRQGAAGLLAGELADALPAVALALRRCAEQQMTEECVGGPELSLALSFPGS